MSSLFDEYLPLYRELKELSDRYAQTEQILTAESEAEAAARARRIARMEEQLKKIGEYRKKVGKYREFAKKYVKSDVLAFVVPRELHFKRMHEWAQKIDPSEEDDRYAQRVLALAMSNEMYLDQKQTEIEKSIAELKSARTGPSKEELAEQKRTLAGLEDECMRLVGSDAFVRFAARLKAAHERYSDPARLQRLPDALPESGAAIGIGGYALALPVLSASRVTVKSMLPDHFDERAGSVLLPVETPLRGKSVLRVSCTPGLEKRLYRALQNYLLNLLSFWPAGDNRIYLLDALHYNSTALGPLRPLTESAALEPIPRDEEELTDSLRGIVSDFSDKDEALGILDTVDEHNEKAGPDKRISRTTLVLIGYPTAFSDEAQQYVRRILLNAERYGVNIVAADSRALSREYRERDVFGELSSGVLRVRMLPESTLIRSDDGPEQNFRWYELRQELSERFVEEVKTRNARSRGKGNVYTDRVPGLEQAPQYTRGNKEISLPYGVDSRDNVHSMVFDKDNFAAFLMGASGSGKSTLLHTLITGILANYHPDDVELWLADFKMAEFARYIDPMPPHVKYILLDESKELVFDLIDRLTDVMMERQRFFMQPEHRDDEKLVEKVDPKHYMPIIFVILDEFSIMSQTVRESDAYRLKLQNLLAKGRALGIKFIFSSQSFTTGVEGLSSTAKKQIQMRIAMKNSTEEKKETLELSSSEITEQVRGWMDALPPYFALSKHYNTKTEKNEVEKVKVMYFPGKGDEAMGPQLKLVRRIKEAVEPVSVYDPSDPGCYLEKNPVVVDGNGFRAFPAETMERNAAALRAQGDGIDPEDILLTLGSPRLMRELRPIVITPESRENLLMLTRPSENACSAAMILSAARCFEAQGGRVQIWAHGKNRIFRAYRDSHWSRCQVTEGIDAVCDAIRELRGRIERHEQNSELIVLLGMERFCGDFAFADGSGSGRVLTGQQREESLRSAGVLAEGEFAEAKQEIMAKAKRLKKELTKALREEGKNPDEIRELVKAQVDELYKREYEELYKRFPDADAQPVQPAASPAPRPEEQPTGGAYNALEDFHYVLAQGSRFGYHFMLCLNSLLDLKQTGLKQELFRHRIAFQLSTDDSRTVFFNRGASELPEHVCLYTDTIESFSFRPYLQPGLGWDGWLLDPETGRAVSALN